MTANAKAETLFEKPLYKKAIHENRCLILPDGFYEWQHVFNKTYMHYIYSKTKDYFLIGNYKQFY